MNIQIASFDYEDLVLTKPTKSPCDTEYWLCESDVTIPVTVSTDAIVIDVATPDHKAYQLKKLFPAGNIPERW